MSLSAALKQGPVVVTFYRGGWCPYCNLQLRSYQALLPELASFGASMLAISPQLPDASLSTAEREALTFNVLSDLAMTWLANSGWSIHCRRNCAMP